jgi:FkbM family methyltransferase
MSIPGISSVLWRVRSLLGRDPDRFFRRVPGVIHVGANTGQERVFYDRLGLRVVWIEPIPEVFATLQANIQAYPRQVALRYLVTDRDGVEYTFHIANNGGASSSILDFHLHKDIWPQVAYERTIALTSTTLATLLARERIAPGDYPALVLDTQGSELLVLRGAVEVLDSFRFIKTEVPDFESYAGCCQLRDIESFVKRHGFQEFSRHAFAQRPGGGRYYDIVYERRG